MTRSPAHQGGQKGQSVASTHPRDGAFSLLSWLRMLILSPAYSAEGRNRGKSFFQETGTERYKWGIFLFK